MATTPQGGRIVRTKTIILGAIAALALATLTANAGNRATHQVQGSLLSMVAAATTVAKTDRDIASAAAKSATLKESTEAVQKPVVAAKPAPRITVSTDCQNAINNLKALRQADATEDAAERAAAQQPASASALEADKAEDAADKQQWRAALMAARTACVPQPSPPCQAAIAALQALKGNGAEGELTGLRKVNWTADLATLRTAIGVVATACGERD
jgi:murein DD-endopeptidase MepM/ murein hydrolase activator NlpD